MAPRFQRLMILTALLVGACGGESEPEDQDDIDEEKASSETGSRDAGKKDARADARSESSDDDDQGDDDSASDDDAADDDMQDDDTETSLDAGTATGPKRDASSDAASSVSDGGKASDAGSASGGKDAATAGGDAAAGGACATLTYESFGKNFVSTYCAGCHGASSRTLKLDTLPRIQMAKVQIKAAAVTSKAMPEGNKLPSDEERAKLGQWLDCGPL